MSCPGSLAWEAKFEDKGSDFADEGTAAHFLASECLEGEHDAAFFLGGKICVWVHPESDSSGTDWCEDIEKSDEPIEGRTFTVDRDMATEVQKYLDEIRSAASSAGAVLMVEQRLPFFTNDPVLVKGKALDCFGTSDVVIIEPEARRLHVRDLKYGRGVQVFAEENEQLMLYALGALDEFGLLYDIDEVVLAIHQPRLNHTDEWVCSVDDLRAFEQRALAAARTAVAIVEPGPRSKVFLTPGESQCRFCKAKGVCPALRDEVIATVSGDFDDLTAEAPPAVELKKGEVAVSISDAEKIIAVAYGVPTKSVDFLYGEDHSLFAVKKPAITPDLDQAVERIASADDEMLAALLDKLPQVEAWCKGVRAEGERRMLAGGSLPGYKLVQGKQGPRSWADPAESESVLKSMRLPITTMYDLTLISPTTAEKLTKEVTDKGKPVIGEKQWKKLQDLIVRSQGGLSVAPAADPRPAVIITPVADDFEALPESETEFDDLV